MGPAAGVYLLFATHAGPRGLRPINGTAADWLFGCKRAAAQHDGPHVRPSSHHSIRPRRCARMSLVSAEA
eukprot:SAG31_NODE_18276_length_641_cov_1.420664_1_plen_69_part_01